MKAIGIGIGLQFSRVVGGLSDEALAWQARIISNGGTIPAATLAIFDQYFFKPALANGNILSELDRLNIYCGLFGYEIAARTNLIKSAHYVTPVSSPTFDNNGYRSAGTGYLNLNYIPSSQGVKYTQNSASEGLVISGPTYSSTSRMIGVAINNRNDINRITTGYNGFINNAAGVLLNLAIPSGNIYISNIRTSSSSRSLIINTTVASDSTLSTGLPNENVFELTTSSSGSPVGDFDLKPHLCSWHGSGNLDSSNLRIILNNLFTALGL